ncbi:restin (Reed-Steinberg cell-expressed intermediate filament-associated protein) [Aphelenchoides avenae]|nr:restin (Reed-Steinberg cell-expressed intermediate filament-associated protein) [Aphelenchus avenae]
MSGEDVFSNRSAASLRPFWSEDNLSVLHDQSASDTGVHHELVHKLTNRIRDLESEITALRRSLPHLKATAGKNVTEEFVRLGNALEEKREEHEELASEFDKAMPNLKKKFRDLEGRAREEKKRLEEKIQQTVERANNFERDNQRLRMKHEEDESRIFHLERGGQRDDARAEPAENIDEDPCTSSANTTTDEIYILHARAARTAGENARLKEQLADAQKRCRSLSEKIRHTAFFLEELFARAKQCKGNKALIDEIRGLQLEQSMNQEDAATNDVEFVPWSRLHFTERFFTHANLKLHIELGAADKKVAALLMDLVSELQHKRTLTEEKAAALEAKRDVEAECADLHDQIEEMKNALESMQLQHSSAVETNETLRQALEVVRERADEVRREFTQCRQRFERIRDDLQRQVDAYEAELRRAEEKDSLVLELRQENLHLLEQNRQLQDDINQQLDEIDKQTRLVKEYSEKVARSEEPAGTLEAGLESKKDSEEQLRQECAEKLAHAHELNEVLAAELKLEKEKVNELANNLQLLRQSSLALRHRKNDPRLLNNMPLAEKHKIINNL